MDSTQWAEFAGFGFAIAVLAWVIYRLTWALVRIFEDDGEPEPEPEPESGPEQTPEQRDQGA